jgi:hypothetical protein
MRTMLLALAVMLATAVGAENDGFVPLFNGKDLSGWKAKADDPRWTISDGVLVGQNNEKMQGDILYTEKSYQNFIIETDVRFGDNIDSGIFFRKPQGAMQVQIGVSRSLKVDMTGSIYVEKKGYVAKAHDVPKVLKLNEWNTMKVEANGPKVIVHLNGQEVLNWETPDFPDAGPIGLQIHPGVKMKVEYRNMKIKELPASK